MRSADSQPIWTPNNRSTSCMRTAKTQSAIWFTTTPTSSAVGLAKAPGVHFTPVTWLSIQISAAGTATRRSAP
jgi:hypothetical protein